MAVVLLYALVFLFVHTQATTPNIVTSCNIHQQYNLATQETSYITCNLTVNSLPDYVYAGVVINACPPSAWPTYDWDSCLPCPADCAIDFADTTAETGSTVCNMPVPLDWDTLGIIIMKVQYFSKYTTTPWEQVLGNFTIVNDPTIQCPNGQTYGQNSYCSNCSIGTYSVNGNCTVCPLGSVGLAEGQTNCTLCNPGYYGGGGSKACTVAPIGYYSAGGIYHSTACAPGTYASVKGSSVCEICPNGTYSCAAATSCIPCPAGKISQAGAAFCTACPPGTYAPASSPSCISCPSNTYSATLAATSSSSCTSCPSGTTLMGGCSHSASCCM